MHSICLYENVLLEKIGCGCYLDARSPLEKIFHDEDLVCLIFSFNDVVFLTGIYIHYLDCRSGERLEVYRMLPIRNGPSSAMMMFLRYLVRSCSPTLIWNFDLSIFHFLTLYHNQKLIALIFFLSRNYYLKKIYIVKKILKGKIIFKLATNQPLYLV